jgi:hypothetical protein
MAEPPVTSSLPKLVIDSPLSGTIESQSENKEPEKLKALETANKLLENELELMKEALRKQQEVYFKGNIDHFGRI